MTTRVTEGASPRFSRLAASPLNARARALPLLNLKKKRDCSQSSLEQTSLNVSRPPATCNFDYAIYTTGIRYNMNSNGTELKQISRTHRTFVPERLSRSLLLNIYCRVSVSIGHYRVKKAPTFKTRLSAKPFLFKLVLLESFRF